MLHLLGQILRRHSIFSMQILCLECVSPTKSSHELVAASSLAVTAAAARFHGTFGLRPFLRTLAKQTSRDKRNTRDKF